MLGLTRRSAACPWGVSSAKRLVRAFGPVFFVFILMISSVWAQTKGQAPSEGPIRIQSDRMETMDKEGNVVFSGHVKATRGDLVIYSDVLKVYYKEAPGKKGKRVIDKIVATGHVKITKEGRMATGESAVYDKAGEKIILSGAAQVWEGPNRVRGEKITFFINEDRSIVEASGSQKVEAVVYPED